MAASHIPSASSVHVLISTSMGFAERLSSHPLDPVFADTGFEIAYREGTSGWPDEETRDKLAGIDGLLAGGEWITEKNLARADRLKIVARNGVGYDRVNLNDCTARGIVVTNTPGVMANAVADLTLALVLATVRHVVTGDRTVKAGSYKIPVGEDLSVMTLGLLGCGRIGAEVVRRALGFGLEVVVYDPWVDVARIAEIGARSVSREELLTSSDIISLHLPLTKESAAIVDGNFLMGMKQGSFLINTARGGLVDEAELMAALSSGHLAGAGLDCQAVEPPEGLSLELTQMDEVVVMPHVGSSTVTARRLMATMAAEQIVDCLQERRPKAVLNPQVLDKLKLQ